MRRQGIAYARRVNPLEPGGEAEREPEARVGLCFTCRHARRVPTPRAVYWLCELAATDPRFEKYPRLPVRACPGYERRAENTKGPGS